MYPHVFEIHSKSHSLLSRVFDISETCESLQIHTYIYIYLVGFACYCDTYKSHSPPSRISLTSLPIFVYLIANIYISVNNNKVRNILNYR